MDKYNSYKAAFFVIFLIIFLASSSFVFSASTITINVSSSPTQGSSMEINGITTSNTAVAIRVLTPAGSNIPWQTISNSVGFYSINFTLSDTGTYIAYADTGGVTVSVSFSVAASTTTTTTVSTTTTTSGQTVSTESVSVASSEDTTTTTATTTTVTTTTTTLSKQADLKITEKEEDIISSITENEKLFQVLEEKFGALTGAVTAKIADSSKFVREHLSLKRKLAVGNTSTLTFELKYNGTGTVKNLVVNDKLPKSFASNASLITVIAEGATIEVIEEDPEFAFIWPSFAQNETKTVSYMVNYSVNSSVLDELEVAVFAEDVIQPSTGIDIVWIIIIIIVIAIAIIVIWILMEEKGFPWEGSVFKLPRTGIAYETKKPKASQKQTKLLARPEKREFKYKYGGESTGEKLTRYTAPATSALGGGTRGIGSAFSSLFGRIKNRRKNKKQHTLYRYMK